MAFSTRPARPRALLAALALTLALAACDSDDTPGQDPDGASDSDVAEDPETALKDAIAAMADWEGVSLDVSFEADEAARASLLEEEPDDHEVLDVVLNSSLRMTAVGDEEDGAFQLALDVEGTDVFELHAESAGESVGAFALRVDLPRITEIVDDPAMTAQVDALIAQAAMFGLQDAAQALADGDWVAISGLDALQSMADDLGGAPADEPDEEQVDAAAQALADRTERFVDEDVDVSHVGSEEPGERLRVVAGGESLRTYLEDVLGILATNDLIDGVGQQDVHGALEDLPADTEVDLDVWLSGGQLSRIALDLAQIEGSDIDGEFRLIVGVSEHAAPLTAPTATATVDVMSLFGQFMGGFGAEGDLGSDEDLGADQDGGPGGSDELSQEDIDLMLQFMECISEEDLEGFAQFMPDLADAAEQAIADGTLEYC